MWRCLLDHHFLASFLSHSNSTWNESLYSWSTELFGIFGHRIPVLRLNWRECFLPLSIFSNCRTEYTRWKFGEVKFCVQFLLKLSLKELLNMFFPQQVDLSLSLVESYSVSGSNQFDHFFPSIHRSTFIAQLITELNVHYTHTNIPAHSQLWNIAVIYSYCMTQKQINANIIKEEKKQRANTAYIDTILISNLLNNSKPSASEFFN